jgi:hypothetical protein
MTDEIPSGQLPGKIVNAKRGKSILITGFGQWLNFSGVIPATRKDSIAS